MICSMTIGSGDVNALLADKATKTHQALLARFTSGVVQRRNPFHPNVPPQFRTGAILETVYFSSLPKEKYIPQYKVRCEQMDVLAATLDFGKVCGGNLVDFIEFKTEWYETFDLLTEFRNNEIGAVKFIKRYHRADYNQIQHQMLCAGFKEATLTRMRVTRYDDAYNRSRRVKPDDTMDIRIRRDDEVIERILERATIFQAIRDYYRINP
jgi:hypothetical protein